MITVDADARRKILTYAARFTSDTADAVAVVVNAGALLAWLEEAPDLTDAQSRIDAMHRQFCGYGPLTPSEMAALRLLDDPCEFLRRAKRLYAFATAGEAR